MEDLDIKPTESGPTLSTSIANRLRSQITSGAIPPGEKLRLDDLRASFGVSLSPLREALSRLAAEGFVVVENRSGFRVAPVSESNLMEVTRLRVALETFALRESVQRGNDQWESEVVASLYRLSKLEKLGDRRPRLEDWENAHRDFHQKLISACAMPLLLRFCAVLHDLNDRYRRLFLENAPIDRDVSMEHSSISEAALARDAEKAVELLRQHIERTGAMVAKALPKP